jgi:hypothetical protein
MKNILYVFVIAFIFLSCFACATSRLVLIPSDKDEPIEGLVQRSVGEANVKIIMPTGENITGTMIWIAPGQGPTVGLATIGGTTVTAMGGNVGGNAMYIGTLIGDKGTKMQIELLCNAFTVKCTGVAIANDGKTYNVVLK